MQKTGSQAKLEPRHTNISKRHTSLRQSSVLDAAIATPDAPHAACSSPRAAPLAKVFRLACGPLSMARPRVVSSSNEVSTCVGWRRPHLRVTCEWSANECRRQIDSGRGQLREPERNPRQCTADADHWTVITNSLKSFCGTSTSWTSEGILELRLSTCASDRPFSSNLWHGVARNRLWSLSRSPWKRRGLHWLRWRHLLPCSHSRCHPWRRRMVKHSVG